MSAKSKVYLGALMVFVCGAISGGFGSAMFSYGAPNFGCHRDHEGRFEHDGFGPEKLTNRLTEKLSLTPDQKTQVQQVLERSMPEMKKMREEHFEARKALRQKVGDQIRGILTPDQQKKFDELRAKMQERMEKRKEGGGRGRFGGGREDQPAMQSN